MVHRGLFDHVDFAPEPFTEREAWLWLISEAAWQPKRVRVGSNGAIVVLARGELAHSLRFLADKWQWSVKRVRGFLDRSEKQERITRKRAHDGAHDGAIITICNYDKYQLSGHANGHAEGHSEGTPRAREGHKEEELKKVIQEIDTGAVHADVLKIAGVDSDDPFFFGSKYGVEILIERGYSPATICAGAAKAMVGKSRPPPWSYFAKCIESENEQRAAPAKPEINRGTTENLAQTAKRLAGEVIGFGPRPSIYGSTEDGNLVRLLPDGTGERS